MDMTEIINDPAWLRGLPGITFTPQDPPKQLVGAVKVKACKTCGTILPLTDYTDHTRTCKVCRAAAARKKRADRYVEAGNE